jgi:DNA-directed RNA polymerase subunit RPC12/RpoP
MKLRPGFKRPGDDIDARVKEQFDKLKNDFDARVKAEVDEKVKNALKEKEDLTKREKADKIARAIDAAKAVKGTEMGPADPSLAAKNSAIDNSGLSCPTCHIGHVHKLETDKMGLVYKCHGDKCGLEYVMTPKNSDYKCSGCGAPVKKPADEEKVKDMTCPFCNGTKALKHDWSKLWAAKK